MLHFSTHLNQESSEWVTFIHGAGGSSSIWFKQIREFQKSFNVLLIDLRGHGRSKNISLTKLKKYSFDVIGDDIIDVLNHLSIDKTHFVGISLGTVIAREISERYPERTSSMVLGGAVMKLNVRSQVLMKFAAVFKSVLPYMIIYKLAALVVLPRRSHKESRVLFIQEAKKLYQKEFQKWFKLTSQINPLLKLFRIKDNKTPTLYIMGSQDYMFLPAIEKLTETHKMSALEVIPDCGHVVNVERPHDFNKRSIDFLLNL